MSRSAPWPPPLPEGLVIEEPWAPMHPEDLAQMRDRHDLGPCEAIECIARNLETGKRELVTQFRPIPTAAPVRASDAREQVESIKRALGGGGSNSGL